MYHLAWINNVATRYRCHLFQALLNEADKRYTKFDGIFMAAHLPGQKLHEDLPESAKAFRVEPGVQVRWNRVFIHLNSRLVARILMHPPDAIVLCGWVDITSVALEILMPIFRRRTVLLMWAEANCYSTRHEYGPVAAVRRFLASRCDALVVPGEIAVSTIKAVWRVPNPNFIVLPNLVDESFFNAAVQHQHHARAEARSMLGIPASSRILLCPARLDERTKGILTFLNHSRDIWTDQTVLVLAGAGPDEHAIREWITANSRQASIKLVGHVTASRLVELQAAADGLVLPSISDPNPLAVIEGLWAGLPLLLSRCCGNAPEAVVHGQNGWLFWPDKATEVRETLIEFFNMPSDELRQMGARSVQIARERFSTKPAVKRFFDNVEDLIREKHGDIKSLVLPAARGAR